MLLLCSLLQNPLLPPSSPLPFSVPLQALLPPLWEDRNTVRKPSLLLTALAFLLWRSLHLSSRYVFQLQFHQIPYMDFPWIAYMQFPWIPYMQFPWIDTLHAVSLDTLHAVPLDRYPTRSSPGYPTHSSPGYSTHGYPLPSSNPLACSSPCC